MSASTLAQKIANFDPNALGDAAGGLFGLPFTPEEAQLVVVPVPWEVTVSYRAGTAQ
ncbi:MAG: agmatinase, partial [Hymenobacter sp.]